jgi:hypothetical protein
LTNINASYVRGQFDAIEVRVPGAPLADEIVFILAMTTGYRIHDRVGGLRAQDIQPVERPALIPHDHPTTPQGDVFNDRTHPKNHCSSGRDTA